MPKPRTHNEHFRELAKHKCPTCHAGSKSSPVRVFSWGEYIHGKWHTVKHFCSECFLEEVLDQLQDHANTCGCTIQFVTHIHNTPAYLQRTLEPIKEPHLCMSTS